MKNLIFLCISVAIVLFTVIVLNNAPIINGLVGENWYKESCQDYVDLHKYNNDVDYTLLNDYGVTSPEKKKEWLDLLKEGKNKCYRNKAMIGSEYASFNFNIVFGLTCAILGLLNYLNVANNIKKIIGLIGLASGIIGFVLTFVYIIYSGIIFNNDVVGKEFGTYGEQYHKSDLATKPDGSFMEWKDGKYVCIFYDKDNKDKLYRKYSNYGNKYLNYNSKVLYAEKKKNYKYMSEPNGCRIATYPTWDECKSNDETNNPSNIGKYKYYDSSSSNHNEEGECDKLYYYEGSDFEKQNIYDCWVTTIVLGCFIFVLDIGLAIFGLLLFLDSSGSKGAPL